MYNDCGDFYIGKKQLLAQGLLVNIAAGTTKPTNHLKNLCSIIIIFIKENLSICKAYNAFSNFWKFRSKT